jgi:hypothetical protein
MAIDPYKYPSEEDVRAATGFFSSSLKRPNVFGTPEGRAALEAERKGLASFLGQPDYDKNLAESENLAKLQLAMSLMSRGFAAAGATPVRGESAASTLSRELLSPVASDIMPIASDLLKQRRAVESAKRQDERQIKLAALQNVQRRQEQDFERAAGVERAAKQAALQQQVETQELSNAYTVDGKRTPVVVRKNYLGKIIGFFDTDENPIAYKRVKIWDKTKSGGLNPTLFYVIEKGVDGKWGHVPQADGKGSVQVRLQKGSGAPYNVQTLREQPLASEQVLVEASKLSDYGLGKPTKTDGTPNLQAGEFNLVRPDNSIFTVTQNGKTRTPVYRVIVDGTDRGKFVDLGSGDVFSREDFKAQGLSPRKITAKKDAEPKGLDAPKFKASFRGMLAQIAGVQETQNLGKTAIRFNAVKFNKNTDLKPGENFPFERVVGVSQADGSIVTTPLTKSEQEVYADNLRASYLQMFDAIRTGEEPANLNNTFITRELRKSPDALGLPKIVPSPTGSGPRVTQGVVPGRDQITNPKAITQAYVNAVPGFSSDVQKTLDGLPIPRDNNNLKSGIGRLVLFNELGVPFGPGTINPLPLNPNADVENVLERASTIRNFDSESVQERVLAERVAKETGVGAKLRFSTADSLDKQLAVLGKALEVKKKKLGESMSSDTAKANVEVLDKTLEMLARLNQADFTMKRSGVPGFITGPLENTLKRYLGLEPGQWFRTPQGQAAAREYISMVPMMRQLFARDILRTAGEQRYTNRDLEGAQSVLTKLGESDSYNADTLRQLTSYLKNIVKSGLNAAGTMHIPPATLEKAAMLGIDLKSITPKNNYYSPYFNQGRYAVTNQPIPQYSKEYMKNLRDKGIFGYAAILGTTGNVSAYKLIEVDSSGNPIPKNPKKPSEGFKTTIVSAINPNWAASVPRQMLDFNRNYLLKTYGLDR